MPPCRPRLRFGVPSFGSFWRLSLQIEANDKTSDKFDAAATELGLDTAADLGPRPRLNPNLKQPGEKENVTCESLFAWATKLKPGFEERIEHLRSFARGTAPGPSGLRAQHLLDALGQGNEEGVAARLAPVVNWLARGEAPDLHKGTK